jgi:transposase
MMLTLAKMSRQPVATSLEVPYLYHITVLLLDAVASMTFYFAKIVAALVHVAHAAMLVLSLHVSAMAPTFAASQHDMIRDMILSKSLKSVDMAAAAGCSDRTIRNIGTNMQSFGSTRAPFNGGGRRRRITPVMLDALREKLLEKPGMYQDEMIVFLYDEFDILVNTSAVSRALASIGWTKKATRQIAIERNAELRDYYLYNLSDFKSYHLIYVDESGCAR